MPRVAQIAPGGVIFHVLNRGNARCQVFEHDGDYEALERVIFETAERIAVRLLAYCIMPNHWHMGCGRHKTENLADLYNA